MGKIFGAVIVMACVMLLMSVTSCRETLAQDGIGPIRSGLRSFGDNRAAVRSLRVEADEARDAAIDRLRGDDCLQRVERLRIEHVPAPSRRILLIEESREPDAILLLRQSHPSSIRIVQQAPSRSTIVIQR